MWGRPGGWQGPPEGWRGGGPPGNWPHGPGQVFPPFPSGPRAPFPLQPRFAPPPIPPHLMPPMPVAIPSPQLPIHLTGEWNRDDHRGASQQSRTLQPPINAIASGWPPHLSASNPRKRPLPEIVEQQALTQKRPKLYNDFTATAPLSLQRVDLLVECSAIKCRIHWSLPPDWVAAKQTLEIREDAAGGGTIVDSTITPDDCSCVFDTTPGVRYTVRLTVLSRDGRLLGYGERQFKAIFALREIERLMAMAVNLLSEGMQPFTHLYRCKPKCYWDQIYYDFNGSMGKYIKDENGQAASPINGQIQGLFFNAKTKNGLIPDSSPFGDVRMTVPAWKILHPGRVNLYFADFYCNSSVHYATVVVAMRGSDTDEFCRRYLRPLDPERNVFLRMIPVRNPAMVGLDECPYVYQVNANKAAWVEIYWTEDLAMTSGQFHNIIATGAGTAKIGGLVHNKRCPLCNLYPAGSTPALVAESAVEGQASVDEVSDECPGWEEDVAKAATSVQPNTDYLFTPNSTQLTLQQLVLFQSEREGTGDVGGEVSSMLDQYVEVSQTILSVVNEVAHWDNMAKLARYRLLTSGEETTTAAAKPTSVQDIRKVLQQFTSISNPLVTNLVSKLRSTLNRMDANFSDVGRRLTPRGAVD